MSNTPDDRPLPDDDDDVDGRRARLAGEPSDEEVEARLRERRLAGGLLDDELDLEDPEAAPGVEATTPGPGPSPEPAASAPGAPGAPGEDAADAAPTGPSPVARPTPVRPVPTGPPGEEEDPLGAAATLPSAREQVRQARRGGSGNDGTPAPARRRGRRGLKRAGVVAAVLLVIGMAAIPLVGGTLEKTPKDRYGISYGGGPFEGERFQKIVEPGSGLFFNGIGDALYLYPADQRNYIVTGGDAAADDDDGRATTDPSAITAPTRDRVEVAYQVAVYFTLNVDLLQQFHEELGLRYRAFEGDGWDRMIQDNFRQQLESALQEQTRRHDVAELFGDVDVLLELQAEVGTALTERLEAALGADYFCSPTYEAGGECGSPTFVIKRIDLPAEVLAAFERNRTAAIDVQTREAEAQAIERLATALAEAGDDYVLLKAIESGKVTFWVLPDGQVSLTAPEGSTGAPPDAPDPADGGG